MDHTVFPAPLGPTMRVKGLKKVMTFLFSGSKLRMPFINILSTVLIFTSCLFLYKTNGMQRDSSISTFVEERGSSSEGKG